VFKEIELGSAEYCAQLDLRHRILRKPLGREHTPEELQRDQQRIHIGCFEENEIRACLSFANKGQGLAQMHSVAVDGFLQGQGVGALLVRFAEDFARKKGFTSVVLNARETAVPFYKKMGYEICSEMFIEVGIPHFKMKKALFSSSK